MVFGSLLQVSFVVCWYELVVVVGFDVFGLWLWNFVVFVAWLRLGLWYCNVVCVLFVFGMMFWCLRQIGFAWVLLSFVMVVLS